MTKTLHERLIDELMEGKVNLSEREHAAKNEIILLRKKLANSNEMVEDFYAELAEEKPKRKTKKK